MFLVATTTEDQGDWYHYATDPENSLPVRHRVRAIPSSTARAIEHRIHGARVQVRYVKGAATRNIDTDRLEREQIAKACYAWVDAENASVRIADAGAAAEWQPLLGLISPPAVGSDVDLGGKLGNDTLKERIFRQSPAFRTWVLERAASASSELEAEEGKDD